MSDLKQRYLIPPDPVLEQIASVVGGELEGSAINQNLVANDAQSGGVALKQPELSSGSQGFSLQLSGSVDTEINAGTVTGQLVTEGHFGADAQIIRAGLVDDARFSWVRDQDDPDDDWQFRQSPLVAHRATHLLSHSSINATRPWRVMPKLVVLGDGTLQVYAITSAESPVSLWDKGSVLVGASSGTLSRSYDNQYYTDVSPAHWQSASNQVVRSELTGYPTRVWDKYEDVISTAGTTQAFTAACVPGTSDVIEISITTESVAVYYQPRSGSRQRRSSFGFVPHNRFTGSGFPFGNIKVYSCDCAFLPSGRLCLVVADQVALRSYTSDDLGKTWQYSDVLPDYASDVNAPVAGEHRIVRRTSESYADADEATLDFVAPNEFCSVSLCVAANGNLVLGTTFPSYTNSVMPIEQPPVSAVGKIYLQTLSKNTLFATCTARTGIYCSVDGLVWGGGSFDTWDAPAVSSIPSLRVDGWLSFEIFGGFLTDGVKDRVYYSAASTLWPYDNTLSGGVDPYNWVGSDIYRWQAASLPAHISVSLGPDGYVDVYLTTMQNWMAPLVDFGFYQPVTRFTNATDSTADLRPGWRCSHGKLLLQHRRFATKTPSPAENPDTWIPITGNTLRRFHTLNVNTNPQGATGGTSGPAGGIATIAWRGSSVVVTNHYTSLITDLKYDDETTEVRSTAVGQVLYELNGWQPLQERLGWSRSVRDATHPYYTESLLPDGVTLYDEGAAQSRIYGATWDCGALPDASGWVLTSTGGGGGTSGLVRATGANHGHLFTNVATGLSSTNHYYTLEDKLPNANGADRDSGDTQSCGVNSVTRFVMQPQSGTTGLAVSGPRAFTSLRLRGGGVGQYRGGWILLYSIDGADLDYALFNYESTGVAVITGTILNGTGQWIEWVVATRETSGGKMNIQLAHRIQNNTTEPDFENPYTVQATEVSMTEITEGNLSASFDIASFGYANLNSGSGTVLYNWNYIAYHRPTSIFVIPESTSQFYLDMLNQPSRSGVLSIDGLSILKSPGLDEDIANNTQASLLYNNSGVLNPLLGGQCSTTPLWISNGAYLTGAGYFSNQDTFRLETKPAYDWRDMLLHPVKREWRSPAKATTNLASPQYTSADLVLPVDAVGSDTRPTGLALMGRNTPGVSFSFQADTGGSPKTVLVQCGSPALTLDTWTPSPAPTSGHTDFINTDYWGHRHTDTSFPVALFRKNRVYFQASSTFDPSPDVMFRPHQFAQTANSPVYYFALQFQEADEAPSTRPMVYRIRDNGSNYLELETDIQADLGTITGKLPDANQNLAAKAYNACIYSDRFAVDIEPLTEALFTGLSGRPRIVKIEVHFHEAWFRDPDHAFHRAGRLVLGPLIDLSEPDCEWQWNISKSSGNRVTRTTGGPSFAYNSSPAIRTFNCTYPVNKPADLPADKYGYSLDQTEGTWRHKVDILNRLGMDGQECVLIWQGEQTNNGPVSTDSGVATTTDPMDLLMVRAGAVYDLQQQQYKCYTLPVRGDMPLRAVPLPFVAIGSITFTEEF